MLVKFEKIDSCAFGTELSSAGYKIMYSEEHGTYRAELWGYNQEFGGYLSPYERHDSSPEFYSLEEAETYAQRTWIFPPEEALKQYIHKASIGNKAEIKKITPTIKGFLQKLHKKKIFLFAVNCVSKDDSMPYNLEGLNYDKKLTEKLPFLYVYIFFFDTSGNPEIENFMLEHGFVPIYVE